jgi:Protein of unknown function (DUF1360)
VDWFLFITVCLTVWRITHLLSKEDGPWDMIFKLRKAVGAGFFGNLLDCFYCLSIWIALPFGLWLGHLWWEKLLQWMAISAVACLLEQATTKDNNQTPHYHED